MFNVVSPLFSAVMQDLSNPPLLLGFASMIGTGVSWRQIKKAEIEACGLEFEPWRMGGHEIRSERHLVFSGGFFAEIKGKKQKKTFFLAAAPPLFRQRSPWITRRTLFVRT